MNFFEHQDRARRHTGRLVFLYLCAMLTIAVTIYVPVGLAIHYSAHDSEETSSESHYYSDDGETVYVPPASEELPPEQIVVEQLAIFGIVFCLVAVIIGGGTLWMTSQLSAGGGASVAEMLGGRQVSRASRDPAEQRLLNVVEEMAIASGVSVPTVFIMDHEKSINAFAAGYTPNEAVVAVTRGTMELLTRDELQGVIAHEFSHILNGDMRLNIRLIGTLYGLELLVLVGWFLLRVGAYSGSGSSSNNRENSGAALVMAAMLFGILVIIVGSIGMFFSSIIKAAISRQREYLADASAVQFTRNPDGIAGALKKIGCPNVGSIVENSNAVEASHMFTASAFQSLCAPLFATHPPLADRIKRIDPNFDGRFPARLLPVALTDEKKRAPVAPASAGGAKALDTLTRSAIPGNIVDKLGGLNLDQLLTATMLLDAIPPETMETTNEPGGAIAAMYAVLMSDQSDVREKQLALLQSRERDWTVKTTLRTAQLMAPQNDATKMTLVQRSFPALRELGVTEYKHFRETLEALVAADGQISLFEYAVKALLLRDLDVSFGLAPAEPTRFQTAATIAEPVRSLLSFLAYSGHTERTAATHAYESGCQQFDATGNVGIAGKMLDPSQCRLAGFDAALRQLAQSTPPLKKKTLEAVIACVIDDGVITPREEELVRAVCAMLDLPCIPPDQLRSAIARSAG